MARWIVPVEICAEDAQDQDDAVTRAVEALEALRRGPTPEGITLGGPLGGGADAYPGD